MRKTVFFLLSSMIIFYSCNQDKAMDAESENPFFSDYNTPFNVPDFDRIDLEHYLPALKKGIEDQTIEIDFISSNTEAPTYSNTIEALEYSGSLLDKVLYVFNNMQSANTNTELQNIAKEAAPLLTAHEDNISLNALLFERVKEVYELREELSLGSEETMLLEKTYKAFVRNGANLSDSDKAKLRKTNEKLALLGLEFGDNLLAEDNDWILIIDKEEDLAGLPDMVINGAAEAADASGHPGKWVITMHKPSWIPFMQYSENRTLREKVYTAWMNRGNNDNDKDNKDIIVEIVKLRNEKANLMGFNTWADYILDNNMAKTPEAVYDLLNPLWEKTNTVAQLELKDMQAMINTEGNDFKLESWDWWYYAEKVRKEKYDLDDETLRPYFELNAVRDGLFYVINQLYGITFEERNDLPKPHPDAIAYEVKESDGQHIGILYMDIHPRNSKSGGAWMDAYRKQYRLKDEFVNPVITTVFNFSKPTGDKPALLTFDEASTMFHELGHALHGLLSDCTYESISGTAVPIDFVELPSQIMENWAGEPQVLRVYARHYETGEVIPDELIEKLDQSSKFNQGFSMTERISASLLDMAWHDTKMDSEVDPIQFEANQMDKIGLIDEIIPRYRSTYYAHIFNGDMYSAGYYSYLWAEVLDADAFNAFKETGDIFDKTKASDFRKYILAKGGTDEPMKLYHKFRGKDPEIEAFLLRSGLE